MSVSSRALETIRAALLASLVGNTLTTTYFSVTLTESENEDTPTGGLGNCPDGGVVVRSGGGRTVRAYTPQSSGGVVQRVYNHTFQIRVSINVSGAPGNRIAGDLMSLVRQIVNLIDAGMEPSSGERYAVVSNDYGAPVRSTRDPDFYELPFTVVVEEPWARS